MQTFKEKFYSTQYIHELTRERERDNLGKL